jgi:tape measure domain-containing protein
MADGIVKILTELDKTGFTKGLNELKGSAESGAEVIKGAFMAIGVTLATAATAIGTIGFNYNKQMEEASAAFKVLLGSADLAKAKLSELEEFANNTPFDLPGVSKAAKTLLAFGVDANDLMPTLKMLGDVSLGNSQYFQQLALVFGQVQAAGKLTGQDLLQMVNVGFNPLEYISKRTGQSMSELRSEMEKGAITTDMVRQAFVDATAEGGRFNGAMDEYAQTFAGRWSTAMDALGKLSGEIIKPMYEFIKTNLLPAITDFMTQLTADIKQGNWNTFLETIKAIGLAITVATTAMIAFKTGAIIDGILASFKAAQLAVVAYTVAVNTMTAGQILLGTTLSVGQIIIGVITGQMSLATAATLIWTKAQMALNAAFLANPIGIVVAIIAVLVAAIIYLWTTNEGFRNAMIGIWNKIVQMFKDSAKWITDTWNAVVAWFISIPGMILKWFQDLPYNMGVLIGKAIKFVIDFGLSLWRFATVDVPTAISKIVSWFSELPGKIWTWLVETTNKTIAWVGSLKDKLIAKGPEILRTITNWFIDLPSKMLEVGKSILTGIWNGISGAAGWLAQKVSTWASDFLAGIKKGMGIASPSKITAGFGEYLAQGLGVGFGKEIGNVYNDMNNAIDLQNAKLNWSVQAGNSYNNIMSTQPITVDGTYTSYLTLDGETITKSVNRINDRRSLQYGY